MSMNSNGPGSTRRARTSRAAGSRVRSDTQLQVRPASSGCMVRRKRNQVSVCSRISTERYSVNRSGQDARSLVIAQTWSMSASMRIELSVWPTVAAWGLSVLVTSVSSRGSGRLGLRGADGFDDLAERVAVGAVVGQLGAEAVLQGRLQGQEGQGVQPDV